MNTSACMAVPFGFFVLQLGQMLSMPKFIELGRQVLSAASGEPLIPATA